MTVQDELTAERPLAAPGPLQNQSCDELRAIAGRGVHGGELYFAAVAELERRAHDSEIAIEVEQAKAASRRNELLWWLAVLVGALAIGAIARVLGY